MRVKVLSKAAKYMLYLEKSNPAAAKIIATKIVNLANNPNPPDARKMAATKGNFMRIRAGDYRIIYFIKEYRLYIKLISLRKDIYRQFNRRK